MENQIYNNKVLSTIRRDSSQTIAFIATLGLQLATVILSAWFFAYDQAAGGFSSLAGLLLLPLVILVFPFTGIVGLILAIYLLKKKFNYFSAGILILTSLLMLTFLVPSFIAMRLSSLFQSTAVKEHNEYLLEEEQAHSNTVKTHYTLLSETFQEPQKIVEAQSSYLVLQDGNVLKLYGFYSSHENEIAFEKYAKESLVGKTVKFDLPNYADFANTYTPSSRTGTFANGGYKWPRDPVLNNHYGEIPVLLFVDGSLINLKYSGRSDLNKYL